MAVLVPLTAAAVTVASPGSPPPLGVGVKMTQRPAGDAPGGNELFLGRTRIGLDAAPSFGEAMHTASAAADPHGDVANVTTSLLVTGNAVGRQTVDAHSCAHVMAYSGQATVGVGAAMDTEGTAALEGMATFGAPAAPAVDAALVAARGADVGHTAPADADRAFVRVGADGDGTVTASLDVHGDMQLSGELVADTHVHVLQSATIDDSATTPHASFANLDASLSWTTEDTTANVVQFSESMAVDTDRLVVDFATSRVGIATQTPAVEVDVNGTLLVDDDASFGGNAALAGTLDVGTDLTVAGKLDVDVMRVAGQTDTVSMLAAQATMQSLIVGTDVLVVNEGTQRVGINKAAPSVVLDVVGDTRIEGHVDVERSFSASANAQTSGAAFHVHGTADASLATALAIGTDNLFVQPGASGFAGINQASPAYELDVTGSCIIEANVSAAATTLGGDVSAASLAVADLTVTSLWQVSQSLTIADDIALGGVANMATLHASATGDFVGDMDVATGALHVNSALHHVGVHTAVPTHPLHVDGKMDARSTNVTGSVTSGGSLEVGGDLDLLTTLDIGQNLTVAGNGYFGSGTSWNSLVLGLTESLDVESIVHEELTVGNGVLRANRNGMYINSPEDPKYRVVVDGNARVTEPGAMFQSKNGFDVDLPVGTVLIYNDGVLPANWVLLGDTGAPAPCNTGTDIKAKYLVGVGSLSSNVRQDYGSDEHVHSSSLKSHPLTLDEMPPHDHNVTHRHEMVLPTHDHRSLLYTFRSQYVNDTDSDKACLDELTSDHMSDYTPDDFRITVLENKPAATGTWGLSAGHPHGVSSNDAQDIRPRTQYVRYMCKFQ